MSGANRAQARGVEGGAWGRRVERVIVLVTMAWPAGCQPDLRIDKLGRPSSREWRVVVRNTDVSGRPFRNILYALKRVSMSEISNASEMETHVAGILEGKGLGNRLVDDSGVPTRIEFGMKRVGNSNVPVIRLVSAGKDLTFDTLDDVSMEIEEREWGGEPMYDFTGFSATVKALRAINMEDESIDEGELSRRLQLVGGPRALKDDRGDDVKVHLYRTEGVCWIGLESRSRAVAQEIGCYLRSARPRPPGWASGANASRAR